MTLDVDLRDRPGSALAAIRADLAEVRSDLAAQRDTLTSEIDGLDRALEALGGGEPTVPAAPAPPSESPDGKAPARATQTEPVCDICGHRAKNANGLKIHKGRSHGAANPPRQTPPRPKGGAGGTPVSQVCDGCSEAFPTPAALLVHLRRCEASE